MVNVLYRSLCKRHTCIRQVQIKSKKQGLFKPLLPVIEIKNTNPYIKTSKLQNISIVEEKRLIDDKKFLIGIGLVFSYPIFILIIELLRRKNIKKFQVILIFTGFFGLYLLLDFSTISSVVGVVYGLVSAFSLAILIIYGSSKSLKFGGLNVAFVQVLFAAIILSPFTYEGFSWMIDNLLVSVFLGFFLTGIGLTTYWYVIRFIPPVSIGTITYLEPVTGVIIGAMILNESLRISQYIGFAIVLFIGIIQVIMDTKNQVQSF